MVEDAVDERRRQERPHRQCAPGERLARLNGDRGLHRQEPVDAEMGPSAAPRRKAEDIADRGPGGRLPRLYLPIGIRETILSAVVMSRFGSYATSGLTAPRQTGRPRGGMATTRTGAGLLNESPGHASPNEGAIVADLTWAAYGQIATGQGYCEPFASCPPGARRKRCLATRSITKSGPLAPTR